jgi:hypothetical protein
MQLNYIVTLCMLDKWCTLGFHVCNKRLHMYVKVYHNIILNYSAYVIMLMWLRLISDD